MDNIVNRKTIGRFIQERLEKNQPYCTLPWTKVWLMDGTKMRNCCYQIKAIGDLTRKSFKEIWNGAVIRDVRNHILNGKFHPICRCHEKVGSIPVHPEPEEIVYAKDISETEPVADSPVENLVFFVRMRFIRYREMMRRLFRAY